MGKNAIISTSFAIFTIGRLIDLGVDVPLENIAALFDAVHEFGRYPLDVD
jgi:hypothetical protein